MDLRRLEVRIDLRIDLDELTRAPKLFQEAAQVGCRLVHRAEA